LPGGSRGLGDVYKRQALATAGGPDRCWVFVVGTKECPF
jgi:hypothetical protein